MCRGTIDWPERQLGDLFDIVRETIVPNAFPTEQFLHFSIPAWDESGGPSLESGAAIGSAKLAITQPTILVSKLNPRIPRVQLVEKTVGPRGCASTEFIPYIPKTPNLSLRFYKWFLGSSLFQERLERIATGSTNSHKRARPFETLKWPVPFPCVEEQKRVAAALDAVDARITKSEVAINKLKQMRTGLLQDLLTKGLDEDGQLRDPRARPDQFNDSPLGQVPRAWKILPISNEVEIEHGFAFDGRLFTDKPLGHRLLVPGNFHRDGGLLFTSDNTKYFAGEFPPNKLLRNGDLLIVMTDLSPLTLILGRTVLLDLQFPVLHNQRIGKFCFKSPENWVPAFFAAQMDADSQRRRIIREATGTTVRHTSPDRIMRGFCARPEWHEQDRIASLVACLDLHIKNTNIELQKLRALKSGLVFDLLSGRVRVPERPDLEVPV